MQQTYHAIWFFFNNNLSFRPSISLFSPSFTFVPCFRLWLSISILRTRLQRVAAHIHVGSKAEIAHHAIIILPSFLPLFCVSILLPPTAVCVCSGRTWTDWALRLLCVMRFVHWMGSLQDSYFRLYFSVLSPFWVAIARHPTGLWPLGEIFQPRHRSVTPSWTCLFLNSTMCTFMHRMCWTLSSASWLVATTFIILLWLHAHLDCHIMPMPVFDITGDCTFYSDRKSPSNLSPQSQFYSDQQPLPYSVFSLEWVSLSSHSS